MLIEDASIITVLGVPLYAYGLLCMIGAALCMAFWTVLCRKMRFPAGFAPLGGVCMLLCGFVLSACCLYCLTAPCATALR